MKEENDSLGSESEFYKLNGSEDREDDEDEEENDDQQEDAIEEEEAEENEDEDEENNEPMNPMMYANSANKIPLNKTTSAPRAIINHANSNNKKQINRQQTKQAQPNKPSIIQSDSSILDNDNPLKLKIKLNKQQQQQQAGINRSRSNSSTSSTQSSSLSYSAAMKKSASAASGTTKPSSSNKARQRKSKSFSESSSAAAAAAAAAFNDASLQMFSGGGGAAGSVGGGGTTETYLIDRYKYAVRHIQQGLSVEEACNKYRISKGALLKCLSGGTAPRGKKTRLTEMEENGIVEWLINYKDLKYNDAIHLVFEQVFKITHI